MKESADDDFRRSSANFISWLQKRGTSVNPKISLTESRRWQRLALDDVAEGEELFALQLADVLNVETSRLQKLLPQELQNLDEWLSLVLVLIYEYGQGEQPAWRPYLDILPARFDTLAFWTPQELEELQGSAVVKKIGREEADETFKSRLLPIVTVHPDIFGDYAPAFRGPHAESVLLELAHRTATLIMAYGFDLEAEQPDTDSEDNESQDYRLPKGMVPLADMLNADGEKNNAHLVQQATSMYMIALKPISKGEEIFNDYGQLPRSDLLRRYGYITDRYKKWDVVEVDSELIVRKACEYLHIDEAAKTKRSELAKRWGVDDDAFDITRDAATKMSALDSALISFIDVFSMDATTLSIEIEADEAPEKPEFTVEIAQLLIQVLTVRRNDFKTTMAEDVALLQDKALPKRHRMAIEVRLGEKEIIATALDSMQSLIAEVPSDKAATNSDQFPKCDADRITKKRKKRKV